MALPDYDAIAKGVLYGYSVPEPIQPPDHPALEYFGWINQFADPTSIPASLNLTPYYQKYDPEIPPGDYASLAEPRPLNFPVPGGSWHGVSLWTAQYLRAYLDQSCRALDCPLRSLELSKIFLGPHVVLLAQALERNTSIKKIDLRDNYILCNDMLKFITILGSTSFDVTEIYFEEFDRDFNTKQIKCAGARVFSAGQAMEGDIPDEQALYQRNVLPALGQLLDWNRKLQTILLSSPEQVDLAFGDRQFVSPAVLSNFLKRLKTPKVLIIDGLKPADQDAFEWIDRVTDPQLRSDVINLFTQLPSAIADIGSHLEQLKLYNLSAPGEKGKVYTWVQKLPEWLPRLKTLKVLTISNSGLSVLDASILSQLPMLEQLNLPMNLLQELPAQLGTSCPCLTRLSLAGNKISSLPDSLSQLTGLRALVIHNNQLNAASFSVISKIVGQAKDLTELKCFTQNGGSLSLSDARVSQLLKAEQEAIDSKSEATPDVIKAFRESGDQICQALAGVKVASAGGSSLKSSSSGNSTASSSVSTSAAPAAASDAVLKQGWLTKKGGGRRNWKDRFFVMTSSELKYFPSESAKEPKGSILLSSIKMLSVVPSTKYGTVLEIVTPSRTYPVRAKDSKQLEEWKVKLNEICKL